MSVGIGWEGPGWWRTGLVLGTLLLAAMPAAPLIWAPLAGGSLAWPDAPFLSALYNSFALAAWVTVLALAIGMPAGLAAALYEFPGRRALLPMMALPLFVPTFLWAIGWSMLSGRIGPWMPLRVDGRPGCILAFLAGAVPLVFWVSFAATLSLTGSQVDAARIAGGERAVLRHCGRYVMTAAFLSSLLAGVLVLSDPGPGQIMGEPTAAAEVLVSFAARYDPHLAASQCFVLALIVGVVAAPTALLAAWRLAMPILARQMAPARQWQLDGNRWVLSLAFAALLVVFVALPLVGLLLPLGTGADLPRSWRAALRTGGNTLIYAGGAGLVAGVAAFIAAGAAGRGRRLAMTILTWSLVLFSLPPMLGALGIATMTTAAPPSLDWLCRSRLTVALALGLRFFPIAALMALRSWRTLPPGWWQAAALHGVPLGRFLLQVILPQLLPALATTVLVVGLLATAEVGTVLLLHPPGHASLPLAIVTIMANAPESFVASLCFMQLLLAAALLGLLWNIAGRWAR